MWQPFCFLRGRQTIFNGLCTGGKSKTNRICFNFFEFARGCQGSECLVVTYMLHVIPVGIKLRVPPDYDSKFSQQCSLGPSHYLS